MIKSIVFYKILFALLVLVSLLPISFEIVIFFSISISLLLLASKKTIISKSILEVLIPLVLILFMAISSALYNGCTLIDFFKDFFYLFKPVLFLFLGYLISQRIDNKSSFLILIINLAVFFSVVHLVKCIIYTQEAPVFSIHRMRTIAGRDNFLELIALGIIFANIKYKIVKLRFLKPIIILLSISFVLYFSRTMFILFILITLTFMGYLRISKKGLRYLFLSFLGVSVFYIYLFSIEIPRESKSLIDNFFYKLKIAPSEIFVTQGDFDIKNHSNLWDHWRAYEVSMATSQLNDGGILSWTIGLGSGSLVDLKFNAPLSDDRKGMRYISLIHNGYGFVLYKVGVIGLLLYLYFLRTIYLIYKKSKKNRPINS